MRTRGGAAWTLLALAFLAGGPRVWAGDDDDSHPAPSPRHVSGHGIFNKLFDAMTPEKAPPPRSRAKPAGTPKVTIINATPDPSIGAEAAFFRRVAVCDQLREAALARNDAELERQADELNRRAWEVYSDHMTRKPAVTADKPASKPQDGQLAKKKSGVPAKGE